MQTLLRDFSTLLAGRPEPPCLSIYQPTHRSFPDNRQDPIRFKNLVRELQKSLGERDPQRQSQTLLEPLQQLAEDEQFWKHALNGLAVLRSRDTFNVYRLQRSVPELAIVADTFHLKPLRRILQSVDRYQLLAIDRQKVRLFEGNRDVLDEVNLAPEVPRTITSALGEELTEPYLTGSAHRGSAGGHAIFHGHGSKKDEVDQDAERFFRAVDRAIWEHHSCPSGLPLVLAALPEYQSGFRRLSHNSLLTSAGVAVNVEALSIDELRERVWTAVEPEYRQRIEASLERYAVASAKGLGSDELSSVARATMEGRIDTLLVAADQHVGGRIEDDGAISMGELADPRHDDVLDDLAELVARRGGKSVILPSEHMPTLSGVAAIYRY